jgi:phage terminase large subunit-like protein
MLAQLSYIELYLEEIKSGRIVAGKKIVKIYEQLVHDIYNPSTFKVLGQDGEYHDVTFVFDPDRADEPVEFIQTFCKQSKAPFAGQPIKLMLWQKALIQAVYGFVSMDTGYRRYQQVLLEIGRKSGKSTILAGLAAYHMIIESGIEVCCGANTRSQAEIIFQETKNMLLQSPALSKRVKKRKYDLFNASQFNTMKPLANNSNLDGLNVDIFLLDELHGFLNSIMFDLIQQSMGVKLEPLIFVATTNGFVRDMLFDEKSNYANEVLNGIRIDHTFLPILYELDATDIKEANEEIKDKKNWTKTLPALGEFRSFSDVDKLIKQSENDKTGRAKLLAKYFNLPQLSTVSWLTWDELNNEETFDLEEFRRCYFIGGFDLSEVNDLTAATLLFMKTNDDKKYIHQMYWVPENLVEQKEKEDQVPYSKWIEKGWLRVSGESKIDVQDAYDWLAEIVQQYDLYPQWQGFDRWGSNEFVKLMEGAGIQLETVIQGAKTFSNPMKELKADFQDGKIIYNRNPVLMWCLANTREHRDNNGNVRPVKGRNQRKRIDGMLSLLDAYVVFCNHKSEFLDLL